QSGEDYYIVVSSSAATGTLGYTLTLTETASPCQNIGITGSSGDTIPCIGRGTQTVIAMGLGKDIYWYNTATGGDPVGMGSTFITPEITTTTSYWASEVIATGSSGSVGPLNPAAVGSTGGGTSTTIYYTTFEVLQSTTLTSVDIFPTSTVGSNGSIIIREVGGSQVSETPYTTTVTGGSSPQTVMLNTQLSPGIYEMVQGTTTSLYRNTGGATFPYTSSAINLLSHSFTTDPTYFYYFYNWQYSSGSLICESPRQEVIATVDTAGNITVTT